MEIPFPIPFMEIWSPIHTKNMLPAANIVAIYKILLIVTPPTIKPVYAFEKPYTNENDCTKANTTARYLVYLSNVLRPLAPALLNSVK